MRDGKVFLDAISDRLKPLMRCRKIDRSAVAHDFVKRNTLPDGKTGKILPLPGTIVQTDHIRSIQWRDHSVHAHPRRRTRLAGIQAGSTEVPQRKDPIQELFSHFRPSVAR
ncbi:hypothetical protein, partial [Mycobacterium avium]